MERVVKKEEEEKDAKVEEDQEETRSQLCQLQQ